MIPSFLVMVGFRLAKAATRNRTLLDLALIILIVVAVLVIVSLLTPGYNLLGTLYEITHYALTREDEQEPGYLLSSRHWRDFLGQIFVLYIAKEFCEFDCQCFHHILLQGVKYR